MSSDGGVTPSAHNQAELLTDVDIARSQRPTQPQREPIVAPPNSAAMHPSMPDASPQLLPYLSLLKRSQEDGRAELTAVQVRELSEALAKHPALAFARDASGNTLMPTLLQIYQGSRLVECINLVLRANSGAAAEAEAKGGRLPLHLALEGLEHYEQAAESVMLLLLAHPAAAAIKTPEGLLPLHAAAKSLVGNMSAAWRPGVVASMHALLDAHPSAACVAGPDGWLPLHTVVRYSGACIGTAACVRLLLEAHSDGAREAADGWLPLHLTYSMRLGPDAAECVLQLLKAHPDAVSTPLPDGWLLLHHEVNALGGDTASLNILQQLLAAYQGAVCEPTPDGWLPLHLAARNVGAGVGCVACVRVLLAANADVASKCGPDGNLPLHHAIQAASGSSESVARALKCIRGLLKAYPGSAEISGAERCLPLHFLTRRMDGSEGGVECLRALLDAYPAAAGRKNAAGALPLHLLSANARHPPVEAVRLLLAAFPEALNTEDAEGRTPVELAEQCGAAPELIDELRRASTANGESKLRMVNEGRASKPQFFNMNTLI